jgi:hypothetical protein
MDRSVFLGRVKAKVAVLVAASVQAPASRAEEAGFCLVFLAFRHTPPIIMAYWNFLVSSRGLNEMLSAKAERRLEQAALLERARAEVVRVGGIRPFARLLRTDPSNLAKMLNDNRRPSRRLIEKLEDYFGLGSTTSTDT